MGISKAGMEEIGAAKALSWYRELDRDFRSSKTGGQCEAIMNLAPRLLQWSLEPPVSEAAANLFKLDSGQDQAFANAIFLRLAEVFKNGSNAIRLCVLKVLLFVYTGHKKRVGSSSTSLLTKERIPNHVEMLRRMKSVAGSGDVTARCLALRALGCLAELGRDSADLHHLVLEPLCSKHKEEVQAALFAAGCLCEVSDSFAAVCLEKVIELSFAMKTPIEIKIGAISLFSKMWLSSSLTCEAQNAGRNLMLRLPSAEIVETTLAALSKLAYKSKFILPDQVRMLLGYVSSDPRASVQMISLISLGKLLPQAMSYMEFGERDLMPLHSIIGNMDSAPALRMQTLRILEKISSFYIAADSQELISLVELNALDRNWSVAFQSLSLLVELTCKFEQSKGILKQKTQPSEMLLDGSSHQDGNAVEVLTRLVLLLCDRLALLISSEDIEQLSDCHHLTSRLLLGCTKACHLLVECLSEMVTSIITKATVQEDDIMMLDTVEIEAKDISKVMVLCRFLHVCSSSLELGSSMISRISSRLEHVAELLARSDAFDEVYTNLVPALLNAIMFEDSEAASSSIGSDSSHLHVRVHQLADRLLQRSKFWAAYKVAKNSCLFGSWRTAESVFNSIADKVASEGYYFWLKALSQLSSAEVMVSNRNWSEVSPVENEEASVAFVEAGGQSLRLLHAALRTLEGGVQVDRSFEFQKRFLQLRMHLLQLKMDLTVLYDSIQRTQFLHGVGDAKTRQLLSSSTEKAELLVSLFQSLAEEFYIVTISFMDIDKTSLQVLYGAMFQCSLLAFCTAYAFLPIASSTDKELKCRECPKCFTYRADVFKEVQRFTQGQGGFSELLATLVEIAIGDLSCRKDIPWLRTQPISRVCRNVWKQLLKLKQENLAEADGSVWIQQRAVPLLKEVSEQLRCITWVLPEYFFKTSPRTQLELFVLQAGVDRKEHSEHIYVSQGRALSLSLGLKVVNAPTTPHFELKMLSCVLAVSQDTSVKDHNLCSKHCSQNGCAKDLFLLKWLAVRLKLKKLSEDVKAFIWVSLEQKRQGFSSCTLDTASLPPGVYEISCLSVCTDQKGVQWMLLSPCGNQRFKVT